MECTCTVPLLVNDAVAGIEEMRTFLYSSTTLHILFGLVSSSGIFLAVLFLAQMTKSTIILQSLFALKSRFCDSS